MDNESDSSSESSYDSEVEQSAHSATIISHQDFAMDNDFASSSESSFDSEFERSVHFETCIPTKQEKEIDANEDPSGYIKAMAVDDPYFLLEFDDVIQDPDEKLVAQPILDGEIRISLSEVFSPIHFWFNHNEAIIEMEDQMEEDYGKLKDRQLAISDPNIKQGLLVAALYAKKWNRASVINPLNAKGEVRVFYVDYGTVDVVSKHCVKLLYKKYLDTPRLSYRARLVNLKPTFGQRQWDFKTVDKMVSKFYNIPLRASVVSYNVDSEVYELDVASVVEKGETTIVTNLREWLLMRGLASEFELLPGNIYPISYYLPTIEALEKNYPTLDEQSEMQKKRIDFNVLLDTKMLTCVTAEEIMNDSKLLAIISHKHFRSLRDVYFPPRK